MDCVPHVNPDTQEVVHLFVKPREIKRLLVVRRRNRVAHCVGVVQAYLGVPPRALETIHVARGFPLQHARLHPTLIDRQVRIELVFARNVQSRAMICDDLEHRKQLHTPTEDNAGGEA